MIIGNKSDLEQYRSVTTEEGISFARRSQAFFLETSAKDFINIPEAFQQLVEEIFKQKRVSGDPMASSQTTECLDGRAGTNIVKLDTESHAKLQTVKKKKKCC